MADFGTNATLADIDRHIAECKAYRGKAEELGLLRPK
jgi:hypothetical protein